MIFMQVLSTVPWLDTQWMHEVQKCDKSKVRVHGIFWIDLSTTEVDSYIITLYKETLWKNSQLVSRNSSSASRL